MIEWTEWKVDQGVRSYTPKEGFFFPKWQEKAKEIFFKENLRDKENWFRSPNIYLKDNSEGENRKTGKETIV